jgi:hypothetical protein
MKQELRLWLNSKFLRGMAEFQVSSRRRCKVYTLLEMPKPKGVTVPTGRKVPKKRIESDLDMEIEALVSSASGSGVKKRPCT